MLVFALLNIATVTSEDGVLAQVINLPFLLIIFGVILFGYFPYWTIKKIRICCQSCKGNRKHNIPNNEEHEDMEFILVDDGNWDADRMKHPDDYDEHHVQYVPYDLTVSQPEENTVHATYDNASSAVINSFETISLSIVSTTQESSISNVNDEDEV